MDYEKAYKEALKRAKSFRTPDNKDVAAYIFPILKGSENITNQDCNYKTYTELVKRLEKVKDAVKKQNYGIAMDILCTPYPGFQVIVPTDWSEKYIADVFEMVGLAKIVREQGNDALTEALQSAMIELAKYREVPQIRQEWSEEDEKTIVKMRDFFIRVLGDKPDFTEDKRYEEFIEFIDNRLKSLKGRYTWKPSEEQMKALLWCVAHLGGADHRVLGELYEHLKKLL